MATRNETKQPHVQETADRRHLQAGPVLVLGEIVPRDILNQGSKNYGILDPGSQNLIINALPIKVNGVNKK